MARSTVAEGSRVYSAAPQEDLHSEEERQAEAAEYTDDDRQSDAGPLPARSEPSRGGQSRSQLVWVPALSLDGRCTWTVLLHLRKEVLAPGRFRRGHQVLFRPYQSPMAGRQRPDGQSDPPQVVGCRLRGGHGLVSNRGGHAPGRNHLSRPGQFDFGWPGARGSWSGPWPLLGGTPTRLVGAQDGRKRGDHPGEAADPRTGCMPVRRSG